MPGYLSAMTTALEELGPKPKVGLIKLPHHLGSSNNMSIYAGARLVSLVYTQCSSFGLGTSRLSAEIENAITHDAGLYSTRVCPAELDNCAEPVFSRASVQS